MKKKRKNCGFSQEKLAEMVSVEHVVGEAVKKTLNSKFNNQK